ncbi:acylphosphatase, partial [Lasiosphaeria miniovina]
KVYFLAHGGRVQGSLYFTRKRAMEYDLTGWVRNTDNNKVEGEAQGTEEAISNFLKNVDNGPNHAHVVRLDREERDVVEDEAGFEVRR